MRVWKDGMKVVPEGFGKGQLNSTENEKANEGIGLHKLHKSFQTSKHSDSR